MDKIIDRCVAISCAFAFSVIYSPACMGEESLNTILDGLSKLQYGVESPLVIGDTIDVMDPTKPKERCYDLTKSDISPDTTGAVKSKISFHFIHSVDALENDLKISYSVTASASANFLSIMSGSSSLSSFGNFESFVKNSNDSALLIIEAESLQGRDMLQSLNLDGKYSDLLGKGDFEGFRKACGTHLVRGWNRHSSIKILYQISNISKEAKTIIGNTLKSVNEASVGIEDLNGKAKTEISTTLSDALAVSSKLGTISASVESEGGAGIADLNALLAAGDPSNPQFIAKLLDAIATASKSFTYANSAPSEFILITHPRADSSKVSFNFDNFSALGKIYKALVRVDERLAQYESYKTKDYNLWSRYFRPSEDALSSFRSKLVNEYEGCKDHNLCKFDIPSKVDGLLLDDFLSNGVLSAACFLSYKAEDKVEDRVVDTFNYLSSLAVTWKGNVSFLKSVDIDSGDVIIISPDLKLTTLPLDARARISLRLQTQSAS